MRCGLHLVDVADAFGLGLQFLVERGQPLVPVPLVRFELAVLVLVSKSKQKLRVVLVVYLADGLRRCASSASPGSPASPWLPARRAGAELLRGILGVFLAARLQVRQQFLRCRAGRRPASCFRI